MQIPHKMDDAEHSPYILKSKKQQQQSSEVSLKVILNKALGKSRLPEQLSHLLVFLFWQVVRQPDSGILPVYPKYKLPVNMS